MLISARDSGSVQEHAKFPGVRLVPVDPCINLWSGQGALRALPYLWTGRM